MPTVEYEITELNRLLGRNFSVEELKSSIPLIGVSLEAVSDEAVVLEVFPNRPDMLSIEGFARAMKGFLGLESGLVNYAVKPSDVVLNVDSSVDDVRPFVGAALVKNVVIDEPQLKSLMDVQEKLHLTHGRNRRKVAIGVHDFDRVASPFFYRAVGPDEASFIPLDMNEKFTLRDILVKHPKGMAYACALDGLGKYPLISDRNGDVLSFPPIINGELTRVSESTENLFIEATGWSQLAVDQAVNMIVTSIADRGGVIFSVKIKRKK